MKFAPLLLFALMFSCGGAEEETSDNSSTEESISQEEEMTVPETPERKLYIDDNLVSNIELVYSDPDENGQKFVYAEVEREQYIVEKYEGQLMKASGHEEGFVLLFKPYDYWDEEEGYLVESKETGDREIILTKAQNEYLGFVDYTKETKNLAWDYFENLFIIYFYDNDKGLYPLRFINEGKTEWDG